MVCHLKIFSWVETGRPTSGYANETSRDGAREERAREREMRIGKVQSDMHEDIKGEVGGNKEQLREFWVDEPEMGLENVQWVVVDETDVLFNPDFQESTRMLLADIAAARGSPVPAIPSSALSSTPDSEATATSIQSISYPFNFILTSATIPTSLATYLSNYRPYLTRLASPRQHHFLRPFAQHAPHGQAGIRTQTSSAASVAYGPKMFSCAPRPQLVPAPSNSPNSSSSATNAAKSSNSSRLPG
ncbi:hypothetical protein CY34DRAFT_15785 [Suillus luteus UH-Slu-Lm8-n1]|uniref:Uncharacterized protein n=1 Tax=Suillus luteus UH-Slu-Lm8-n1 TaxID=930992 RepID=A0A0D0A6W0_9AGAM|nr:hypothetical protein CY34DRAFT_15785 [Suillus luteus UH-Slu-Lm8-n1]